MSDLLSVAPFHRSLDYHSERHNVLASNVANANTPGFRPKELLRVEAEELKRLRREVASLREDNEILKKAAAYFAKESL